jgi:hypothetical protein
MAELQVQETETVQTNSVLLLTRTVSQTVHFNEAEREAPEGLLCKSLSACLLHLISFTGSQFPGYFFNELLRIYPETGSIQMSNSNTSQITLTPADAVPLSLRLPACSDNKTFPLVPPESLRDGFDKAWGGWVDLANLAL